MTKSELKNKHKVILALAIASPIITFLILHSAHSLPFISHDLAYYVSFSIITPLISLPLLNWCFVKKINGKSGFDLYTENKNRTEKNVDFLTIIIAIPAFAILIGWLSVDLFSIPSAVLADEHFVETVELTAANNAGRLFPKHQSIVFRKSNSSEKFSFLWPKDSVKDTFVTSGRLNPGQNITITGRSWVFGTYIDNLNIQ